MRGQLSAEMLILIAVILAVVALVGYQLMSTAHNSANQVQSQADKILSSSKQYSLVKEGGFCVSDEDCLSNSCADNICQ